MFKSPIAAAVDAPQDPRVLEAVYALQSSVKSVPLRALLTVYPQLFVIDGTSVAERSRGATPVPSF